MRLWRKLAIANLAVLALVAGACSDSDDEGDATAVEAGEDASATDAGAGTEDFPDKLIFAAVPAEENEILAEAYGPFIKKVSETLGIPIEVIAANDYAGVIEAQIAGRVDMAQYGPFSYVIATNNGAKIDPIGVQIEGPGEPVSYQSYGITRGDSPIKSLADFRGKKVCFVDPSSTSGFLYPSAGLLKEGIDPETGVTPIFAGGHDASALAVAKGDCEAGFAFDKMVDEVLIDKGEIKAGDLKVVWKSEPIANSPLAIRRDLPEALKTKIAEALLSVNAKQLADEGRCEKLEVKTLGDGTKACTFTGDGVYGYVAVTDSTYDGVRAVCEQTKSEKCNKA